VTQTMPDLMQTADVADLLGVPVRTIQRWTETYAAYLTESAQPVGDDDDRWQRFYSWHDVYVLNTVRFYLRPELDSSQPRRTSVYVRQFLDKVTSDDNLIQKLPGHQDTSVPNDSIYRDDGVDTDTQQTLQFVQELTITQNRLRVTLAEIARLEAWLEREEARADEAIDQRKKALIQLAYANRHVTELRISIDRNCTELARVRRNSQVQFRGAALSISFTFMSIGMLCLLVSGVYITVVYLI